MDNTLWVPHEVQSLRSKAREQLAQNQPKTRDTEDVSPRNLGFEVTLGSELLRVQQGRAAKFTAVQTGCSSIDDLLHNVVKPGLVSLAGDDAGCRTILSLHCIVGFLLQHEMAVALIDTTGSFDVVRVLGVLRARGMVDPEQQTVLLDRLRVSRVFDVEGLEQIVRELEREFEAENGLGGPGMIVLDNVASLFTAEMSKNKIYGHAQLDRMCLRLRRMISSRQLAVLMLNGMTQPSTGPDNKLVPVPLLGRSFADFLDMSMVLRGPILGKPGSHYSLQILDDQSGASSARAVDFQLSNSHQLQSVRSHP